MSMETWLQNRETEQLVGKVIPTKCVDGLVGEFAAAPPKQTSTCAKLSPV